MKRMFESVLLVCATGLATNTLAQNMPPFTLPYSYTPPVMPGPPSLNADARMNGIACAVTRPFGKADVFEASSGDPKLLTKENIAPCLKEAVRKVDEMEKAMPSSMFPNKPPKPAITIL